MSRKAITIGEIFENWDGSAYNTADFNSKRSFHLTGTRLLRKVADIMGLPKGSYEARSCKGGMAVSGEVILHTNNFYVCVGRDFAYYRSCKGQRDYTGGTNHNFPPQLLDMPTVLAARIASNLGMSVHE